jgi:uncharacterized protein YneF (UPF0154 family)
MAVVMGVITYIVGVLLIGGYYVAKRIGDKQARLAADEANYASIIED